MSDVNQTIAEVKSLVDAMAPVMESIKSELAGVKRDVVDQAKFDKMNADLSAKLGELQAKNAKLEAAFSRVGPDGGDESKAKLAEHKDKVEKFLRNTAQDSKQSIEIRAMSTNVQPDGGYLVRPELSNTVVSRVFETTPMRQVANVESGSAKSRDYLIDDNEAESGWVGEGLTMSETDTPQIGQKEIVAHTQRSMPSATWEMLQDGYLDVEAWLASKVADKFARTENSAFVNGNGINKPKGFLTYANYTTPGVYERDRLEQVITGASANVSADGFIRIQASLKEQYQARAAWMMKRATWGETLTLKGADNFYFSPTLLPDGRAMLTLLGRPVYFADDMQAVGASNLCAAYGDFSVGYTIYDRVGLQIIRDPFVLAAQGRVRFVTYKRVGGDVTNFEAIKIARCAAS